MQQKHQPRPNARCACPRVCLVCAKGEGTWNPHPVSLVEPRSRRARLARARGRHCPTNMHTHGSAALPRPRRCAGGGRGREPGSLSGRREHQTGRVPASGARAYASLLTRPRPCPAHLFSRARAPRAPNRARARACAGQGPPGAAP